MFIGREHELSVLNKLYMSDKFEFAVIYGRRRVGKTALINQFISDKKAIYFMGVESNAKQNLENFSRIILYPAVFLLVFGIFIGAIWANVSWGRYWGWDPKQKYYGVWSWDSDRYGIFIISGGIGICISNG